MSNNKKLAAIAVLLLSVSGGTVHAAPQSSSVALAPHRAVYDMSLSDASSASNVSSLRGRMVFDFRGSACAGYTVKSRLVSEVVDREGNATTTDLRSTTWEDQSGKRFRFENSEFLGSLITAKVEGEATRSEDSETIEVDLQKPAEREVQLEGEALFPTQHSVAILEAAQNGKSILQADIFDASQQADKLYRTTTFIGAPAPARDREGTEDTSSFSDPRLDELQSWPVAISYYDMSLAPQKDDGLPVYEMAFHMFANGVSRDLVINYGTFLVKGTLARVDYHEAAVRDAENQ